MAGQQAGLDEQHSAAVQEGSEQTVLPETTIIQHLQEAPVDVLSVHGHQHSFLRCDLLGWEHIKGRPFRVGKAGQTDWLDGRHEAVPPGDSGGEEKGDYKYYIDTRVYTYIYMYNFPLFLQCYLILFYIIYVYVHIFNSAVCDMELQFPRGNPPKGLEGLLKLPNMQLLATKLNLIC